MKFVLNILLSLLISVTNATAQTKESASPMTPSTPPLPHEIPQDPNKPMTVEDLQKKYPGARIQQVPASKYDCLKAEAMRRGAPQTGTPIRGEGYYNAEGVWITPHYNYNSSGDTQVNFWPSWSGGGSGGGGDKDFLIIVAVIGVVIVAALVIYSIAYIIEASASGLECRAWSELGFRSTWVSDASERQNRSGNMTGLYYSLDYKIPIGVMGLTGELGYHTLDIDVKTGMLGSTSQRYEGTYLMAGPTFTIPFDDLNGHAFQIELLAGTSTEKEIGLMSTMRFGFHFNFGYFGMGLNFGAALTDVKGFDGYLTDADQLNYMTGFGASYRF